MKQFNLLKICTTKLQKQGICFMKTKSTEETIDEFNNSLIKRNKKKI